MWSTRAFTKAQIGNDTSISPPSQLIEKSEKFSVPSHVGGEGDELTVTRVLVILLM